MHAILHGTRIEHGARLDLFQGPFRMEGVFSINMNDNTSCASSVLSIESPGDDASERVVVEIAGEKWWLCRAIEAGTHTTHEPWAVGGREF